MEFDWIIGTSTGALNAALIAQRDLGNLEKLWKTIGARDIYKLPNPGHLRRLLFGQQLGFFDTSPLETILREYCSLDRLRSSGVKVGFVTTDLCSLKTKLITVDDITSDEELVDVLMASSALPILFPPRRLRGEGCWIDGGLVRNTPIQAAIRLGATEVYAVLVEPSPDNTCPTSLYKLISRLLEIMLDNSARSGIAHVNHYNRLLESPNGSVENWCLLEEKARFFAEHSENLTSSESSEENMTSGDDVPVALREKVSLFLVKPRRQSSGSLLDIDPIVSQWLMKQGYDDIIRHSMHII